MIVDQTMSTTDCETALTHISNCYANATDCDSTSGTVADNDAIQAGYQTIFGPWIEAQVITAAEIGSLTPDNTTSGSLSYEIEYQ